MSVERSWAGALVASQSGRALTTLLLLIPVLHIPEYTLEVIEHNGMILQRKESEH